MQKYWFIKGDFLKERSGRMGASDIPAIIPNPEKPTESLAGYGRTAITVYKEKIGELVPDFAGLPAEMGHYLENKTLELFIRNIDGYEMGQKFRFQKEAFESKKKAKAENYQLAPWFHSVQYYNDDMIVHPDMVYDPQKMPAEYFDNYYINAPDEKKKVNGITIDLSEPFIVEAKSARGYATKRPEGSEVSGYDFDLNGWKGIPLKHYVQIQYQLALMQINTGYLALTYDTSNYAFWKIPADTEWQDRIIDITGKMIKHIKSRTIPKELAISAADVMEMYPKIDKDYCMVMGDEAEQIKELCMVKSKAKQQQDNWNMKEKDAKDALAVKLREYKEIREGSDVLARWKNGGTAEGLIMSLKQLAKERPLEYRYLERKGLIKPGYGYRYVDVVYKGEG